MPDVLMLVEVRVPTILKRSLSTALLFVTLYGYTYVGPSLTSSKVNFNRFYLFND